MLDVLVVEDSLVMQAMLSDALKDAGFNVTTASTFSQAKEAINLNENGFFLTTLDIGLPDTKGDEIVTYMIERSIPSIVYSGSYDYDKVEEFMSKPIIDYVIKNSDNDIEYIVKLAKKLEKYKDINLLIVDDCKTTLAMLRDYLSPLGFNLYTAEDGVKALQVIEERNISVMVTDYFMPNMDGFELVQNVRKKYNKNDLIIISTTSDDSIEISTKMLKYGANSFLRKPYSKDELNSVLNNQMSALFDHQDKNKYQKDLTQLIKKIKVDNLKNNVTSLQENKINRDKLEKALLDNQRLYSIINKLKSENEILSESLQLIKSKVNYNKKEAMHSLGYPNVAKRIEEKKINSVDLDKVKSTNINKLL